MTEPEKSPADQLIELLVYAPVGLIYEYGDVLPQLVKRGKSQVQLAKVMGQMAAKQGQQSVDGALLDVAGSVAKGITEVGALLGLAPSTKDEASPPPPTKRDLVETQSDAPGSTKIEANEKVTKKPSAANAKPKAGAKSKTKPKAKATTKPKAATTSTAAKAKKPSTAEKAPTRLPIARYDELTAREIVPLLDDLTAAQVERVKVHETDGRKRKTILAKIDRLQS